MPLSSGGYGEMVDALLLDLCSVRGPIDRATSDRSPAPPSGVPTPGVPFVTGLGHTTPQLDIGRCEAGGRTARSDLVTAGIVWHLVIGPPKGSSIRINRNL